MLGVWKRPVVGQVNLFLQCLGERRFYFGRRRSSGEVDGETSHLCRLRLCACAETGSHCQAIRNLIKIHFKKL